MVGQTVGKYRVVSRLGRGGMGTVYKAVDETLDREVAIKRLNQDLTEHEVLKRFRAEAITLARLNHPNIATLFELTELDGELLMVMEFVRGETFEGLCERLGAIPIPRAVELCSQVFDALAHAHRAGIVHRDLKPANLMLAESGVVKVMDFGLARMAGAEHLTNDGYMVGTPAYMSPEQVLGGEVDGRADLYAMAVVLYRLLSGQLPFKARSGIEMAHKQMYDPPTPVRQLRTELPDACEAILLRALAKVPDERYQTADEFRAALAPLAAEAISASRSLSGYASADFARTVSMPAPAPAPPSSSGSASLDSDMETRLMSGLSPAMMETALSPLPAGADSGAEPAAADAAVADAGAAEAAVAQPELVPASQAAAAPPAVPVPAARKAKPKGAGTVVAAAVAGLLLLAIPVTIMYMRNRRAAEAIAEVSAPPPPPPVAAAPAPPPVSVEASADPAAVPPPDAGAPTAAAAAAPPPAKPNAAAAAKSTAAANAAKAAKTAPAPVVEAPVEATPPPPEPPPAPSVPSVTFPKMKVLLLEGDKTRDRDAALRFDSEELHVMDGHTPIKSAAYRDVIAVYQSHSREPQWTTPDGKSIAVAKTGGKFSFFKGVPDWITVRTKEGFIPLRVDDSDLRHLIAELEARTGTKVVRTK